MIRQDSRLTYIKLKYTTFDETMQTTEHFFFYCNIILALYNY